VREILSHEVDQSRRDRGWCLREVLNRIAHYVREGGDKPSKIDGRKMRGKKTGGRKPGSKNKATLAIEAAAVAAVGGDADPRQTDQGARNAGRLPEGRTQAALKANGFTIGLLRAGLATATPRIVEAAVGRSAWCDLRSRGKGGQ
jgi:hypothetical protein